MAAFSAEAKRQVAEDLLQIWRSEGGDFGATPYVNDVLFLAEKASESKSTVSITDLPAPEKKKP